METGQQVIKAFKRLQSQRSTLDDYWKQAFQYSYPIRGQGFYGNDDPFTSASAAKTDQAKLYDTTGTDACRLLAASMLAGLTPKDQQWFALTIPNVADAYIPRPVRAWLQTSSEMLTSMIHSSNYNAQAFDFFIDVAVAGQAGLFIELDEQAMRLNFEVWPLASLYIADSTKAQRVDTVYRRVMYTLAEAAEKFGTSNLTNDQRSQLERDPDSTTKHPYVHAIRPRFRAGKRAAGKVAKAMPFQSIYVCERSGSVVYESGFQEFPLVIPRWTIIPGTEYAVGPMNDALPDVKTLNRLVEMVLTNGEMAIAGTFVAKDDGVMNPSTIRIGARKIIFAADVDNIKPLASGGNWNIAGTEIQRLQGQIKRVMMSDELAPSEQNRPMTAEEVRTRTQIIRQVLGPTFGRLQAEFLNPLIDRCFNLALRAGMLGQPPEELFELPSFIPEFKSPLARAQRMDDVSAMNQFEANLAQQAQSIGPQVYDLYDVDRAIQKRAEILGIPVELIRDQREVETIRKQRADAEAAQQQAELQAQALNARPSEDAADQLVNGLT